MTRLRALVLLLASGASALACGSKDSQPANAPKAAVTDPFPAPFTAEEIRQSTRVGRTYRFRVDVKGKPATFRTLAFTAVTNEAAEITATHTTEGGAEVSPAQTSRVTWRELQSHGEFPRPLVTRGEEEVDLGALGRVFTVKYTVQGEKAGEREVFHFDLKRAGAPVLFFHEENGERVRVTTLVDYKN